MTCNQRWRLLALIASIVVLALLAGCGDDDARVTAGDDETTDDATTDDDTSDDGGAPVPIDTAALTESTWVLRFGGGPDGEVPIVQGWPVTITFDDGTVGGTAACNGYGGSYSIDGSQLIIGELSWTEMGCQPDVQASEAAFLAALADVDGIGLVGEELALSGPATELIFGPTEPVPVEDLIGQLWLLEALIVDAEETPAQGDPATLLLAADGTFTGSTGCRTIAGDYIVAGNEVLFTSWGADGDCPTSLFDQDSSVVSVVGDGFEPIVEGDTLILSSSGNEGLRYRAVSEDELSSQAGTPVTSDAELLAGIEWVFVGGDSPDGPIADPSTIDPTAEITLVFIDMAYEGTVVCNVYGGSADIGDSLWSFALGQAQAEEEGCGEGVDRIAAAYLDALPEMNEGGLEADDQRLVMNGNGIELHFERAD